MPEPFIKYLRIENYKSIDKLELHDLPPFAVFAGANGSGKSNFFDALEFVSKFIRSSFDDALAGDFANIHSVKRSFDLHTIFEFEIKLFHEVENLMELPEFPNPEHLSSYKQPLYWQHIYKVCAKNIDTEPFIEEWYKSISPLNRDANQNVWDESRKGQEAKFHNRPFYKTLNSDEMPSKIDIEFPIAGTSSLLNHVGSALVDLLRTLRAFAITPNAPKYLFPSRSVNSELHRDGSNLASVLARLQNDDEIRETILDFMQLCVPGLENVSVKKQSLDDSMFIHFKEIGTNKEFPARLISEGTIYLLSLLVAVLDVKKRSGITMIEEPERGLHPEAISQIIAFMRERATPRNPIWLTTHSEAVVRATQEGDLYFVEKQDGRTVIKPALPYTNGSFTRDRAWLSNALGGGLPW